MIGVVCIIFSFSLVFFLQYLVQREVSAWSGLLLGFTIGVLQGIDINWLSNDTALLLLKLSVCGLCLLLLLGPPTIRLLSRRNPFQPGLLRSILAGSVGWLFWTGSKAIFNYIMYYPLTPQLSQTLKSLSQATICGIFLAFMIALASLPYITGVVIAYCASGERREDSTRYFAVMVSWLGLCLSFWQIDPRHLSSVSAWIWVDAAGSLLFLLFGAYNADKNIGPIARTFRFFIDLITKLLSAS